MTDNSIENAAASIAEAAGALTIAPTTITHKPLRLNKTSRQLLLNAVTFMAMTPEGERMIEALYAAGDAMMKMAAKEWPQAEMEVLLKHHSAKRVHGADPDDAEKMRRTYREEHRDALLDKYISRHLHEVEMDANNVCSSTALIHGGTTQFFFALRPGLSFALPSSFCLAVQRRASNETVRSIRGIVFDADGAGCAKVLEAANEAQEVFTKATDTFYSSMSRLIRASQSFEDVTSFWPQAEDFRGLVTPTHKPGQALAVNFADDLAVVMKRLNGGVK